MRLLLTFISVAIFPYAVAQSYEAIPYEHGWSANGDWELRPYSDYFTPTGSGFNVIGSPYGRYDGPFHKDGVGKCSANSDRCSNGTTCRDHCKVYTEYEYKNGEWVAENHTLKGEWGAECTMVCECDRRTHFWRYTGSRYDIHDWECVENENKCEKNVCPDGSTCVNYPTIFANGITQAGEPEYEVPSYDCLCGPLDYSYNAEKFGQVVTGDLHRELDKVRTRHWSSKEACIEVLEDMGKWKSDWIYKSVTVDTTDEVLSEIKLDYNGTGGEAGFGKSSENSKTCARFLPGDGCDNGKWTYIDDKVPENSFQFCDRMATWSHKPKWPF